MPKLKQASKQVLKRELKRVLIMAGGTGGHVFPGLAVADYFKTQNIEVNWLGTHQGLESHLVPEANIPLHFITISGVRGKGWKAILLAPFKILLAIAQAIKVIRVLKPDVIIGMGGFVSGPGGVASFILGKKLVIHEQNAKSGMTNQWLAKIATKVLTGFPDTFSHNKKSITIGNPIRQKIAAFSSPLQRLSNLEPRLLVIGGSLGAQSFNTLLPQALALLTNEQRPSVWHQTGEKHYAPTVKLYQEAGIDARIEPFIQQMDQAYAWANMVLCRAGALTIAELCAAGLGAILVPYPYAVDDHQTANAHFMVKQKAAFLIQQSQLTAALLAEILKELCASADKRLQMANAAYQLRIIDATQKVLTICKEIYT